MVAIIMILVLEHGRMIQDMRMMNTRNHLGGMVMNGVIIVEWLLWMIKTIRQIIVQVVM